jgi:aminoglycoside phosphotransferase (APT) family kinase protein
MGVPHAVHLWIMCCVVNAAGTRIGWVELPESVRAGVEQILGAQVVEAVSQVGGFSPGTADRVRTAGGCRAFVKAVNPDLNERSAQLHRREARVTASLPASVPAPRLLGVYDDGGWVALVFEDIEGRNPVTPWRPRELEAVLAALATLAERNAMVEVEGLPETGTDLAEDLGGWHRIAANPPEVLDPWVRARLPQLCDWADRARQVLTGNSLVHTDIRADNLLVRPDGGVVIVDWPWATRGPAWFDTLALLINARLHGGHDVEALLRAHTPAGTDPEDLTCVLAGLAGYFLDASYQPAPAGLPTVRAFQAVEATAALGWLRQRRHAA